MAVDPLSPIAPARIRALLLPVGRIKRSRFLSFVELLQTQSMVRLGDISPDPRPDRNMFSPLAFPSGTLLYELSTSLPAASQLSLSPFEQFREPLLIIGIGDGKEYARPSESRDGDGASRPEAFEFSEDTADFHGAIEDIREQFPKAYLQTLMLFDCISVERHPELPQETILVPPISQLRTTTMKTIMCDLTSTLLAEMTTLARSIQALPTVPSPASFQNGSTEGPPSWAVPDLNGTQMSRRNSQVASMSRPESPAAANPKELHRMSMPVLPSASGGPLSTEDPRAASPTSQGSRTPPTTFDEIPGVNANSLKRTNSNSTKPLPMNTRDASADRVSIHGFGSGGVGERARNKGKGRISIVIGTLYLSAGQWHEALKELVEGARRARDYSDHLWHGKALENILVCLLLFAWSGMDFQIPSICYPTRDKSSGSASGHHTPSSSVADITSPVQGKPPSHGMALENLNALIPDLVNMIINVYIRASNFAGESLPPLAFSECIIRFSKLLAGMNLSAGFLDDDALQHLVQNTPFRQKPRLSVPRISVNPTRHDIATMLFRALPAQSDALGLAATDRVVILAGVASVLSQLGLQRKKAIVMKEFITSLIPGLVQARKVGAAEMGVHPAAGLAALNMASGSTSGAGALNLGEGEVENGIDEFLGLLGRTYGIPESRNAHSETAAPDTSSGSDAPVDKMSQAIVETILKMSSLKSFGSLNLKLDILRMCINFCEALPDLSGVLHFTALLLRIAGPGTAPKSNSTDVFVSLPREEQVRLFANISRTVTAAHKLGLDQVETDYWDDFLVRGVHIMEEPFPMRLTHHQPTELKTAAAAKDGPFIHNPWLKQPVSTTTETILVANAEYRFVIALQNPYDFEVEVKSLKIAADGVDFSAHEEFFVLGPYRTQKFPIVGVARSPGTLNIKGCYVKATGCKERLFPIFPDPWKPEKESKMKRIGLKACLGAPASRPASAVSAANDLISPKAPRPQTLEFAVIPDQPLATVPVVSLAQGALMVLEGERMRFTITLQNDSRTTAIDFVHISFQDSASSAIQAATTNRDLPATELHELEMQLAHYPSLRWCHEDDDKAIKIEPGQRTVFEIEVVGRTRLTDAVVQIDYANLGKRRSEVQDRFFTRQVSVPISITVNASVQLQRPDIISLSGDFAWSDHRNGSRAEDTNSPVTSLAFSSTAKKDARLQKFIRRTDEKERSDEYCMLLLDLRNSWPNPLSVSLQVRPSFGDDDRAKDLWEEANTVREVIQPGHVSRVVIILPKIHLQDPFKPVPSLNPANQRQFVVSTSKISPEAERASREAFWYRHELLNLVRGSWNEDGNGRHGELELRSIRLSPRMTEAIKSDDVMIEIELFSDYPTGDGSGVLQVGREKFEAQVDEFLTLKTKVHNRSSTPINPLLRVQPHLAGLPHNIALDLDKRLSWSGVLQRKLPVIQPGETVESELGLIALCSGVFEIGTTVEETDFPLPVGDEKELRSRGNTATRLQADVLGEPTLRSWHSKEPCTIIAKRRSAI
ncbi:hypercellular protein-like protein HypA [Lophiostoma macrostomum CBS 122681]|uniref:Hypercellular protein-like protein HypA n=1 Tax=Lophiostoma macrostomum CBS 122681 TaxID=1314788 RepID=A0A6A6TLE9_9PLEO|nr:hypercellular protein-like protein HypA [Lophiostoma macrostomum CBS 122681]